MARSRLRIPKVLAISVLALGCPQGNDGDTGNDTGGTTSVEVPDCASHPDEMTCSADSACFWEGTDIGCLVDCSMLDEQAACESLYYCEWADDACYTTI